MPIGSYGSVQIAMYPEVFNEAIERHGQHVRWYTATPCFCIDDLGHVDPQCRRCLGRGFIYSLVTTRRRFDTRLSFGGACFTTTYPILRINRIFNTRGVALTYTSFSGNKVVLSQAITRGDYFYIDYDEDLEHSFTGAAVWEGNGLVRVSLPKEGPNTGGASPEFVGTISNVTSLTNVTTGRSMRVLAFWEDMILTDDFAQASDVLTCVCTYVSPIKFLVNNITQKERDESFAVFQDADASASFSGTLPVGKGDLITLLKAEQKTSIVGTHVLGTGSHVLPFFCVKSVVTIEDALGSVPGVSLVKNNELVFSSREPNGKFAVSFMYRPTFIVHGLCPSLRYGENKIFPKRVALKRYDILGKEERRPRPSGTEMENIY